MSAPDVRLEPVDVARSGDAWRTTWHVRNHGDTPATLETVTVPHALYRAPERTLGTQITPGNDATFTLDMRVQGSPGGLVENAFVLLVVRRGEERWRLLFRVRVPIAADGTPRPAVESVTTHRVGFSDEE